MCLLCFMISPPKEWGHHKCFQFANNLIRYSFFLKIQMHGGNSSLFFKKKHNKAKRTTFFALLSLILFKIMMWYWFKPKGVLIKQKELKFFLIFENLMKKTKKNWNDLFKFPWDEISEKTRSLDFESNNESQSKLEWTKIPKFQNWSTSLLGAFQILRKSCNWFQYMKKSWKVFQRIWWISFSFLVGPSKMEILEHWIHCWLYWHPNEKELYWLAQKIILILMMEPN